MAKLTLCGLALAAVLTTACDQVQQKKPVTVAGSIAARSAVITSPAGDLASSAAEASIRLFGRGIDRQRQTRI